MPLVLIVAVVGLLVTAATGFYLGSVWQQTRDVQRRVRRIGEGENC